MQMPRTALQVHSHSNDDCSGNTTDLRERRRDGAPEALSILYQPVD